MKYKILENEFLEINGVRLYKIQALKSFGEVIEGDIGGYIEKAGNLSQKGDAWVFRGARVNGNAKVFGNAQVFGDAWVYGDAQISDDAWVYGNARVSGEVRVSRDAMVCGEL